MELSDLVIVTKADGELVNKAREARFQILSALKFIKPKLSSWRPTVTECSSATGHGIPEVWKKMDEFWNVMLENGELAKKRGKQRQTWMWRLIHDELDRRLLQNTEILDMLPLIEEKVRSGTMLPNMGADYILSKLYKDGYSPKFGSYPELK